MEVREDEVEFSAGGIDYRLEAWLWGNGQLKTQLPLVWGATVEGRVPEEDTVEPHVISPPDVDNLVFRLTWNQGKDIRVIGAFDTSEEPGGKKPIAGTHQHLVGQIGEGSREEIIIHYYEGFDTTSQGFAVTPATIVTAESKTVYLKPDAAENLARGGFDLVIIPGRREVVFEFQPPTSLPLDVERLKPFLRELPMRGMKGVTMGLPSTTAARVTGGRFTGRARKARFEGDPLKAVAVKFRVRVRTDVPPLEGTKACVAWVNSQKEAGSIYQAVICSYCGGQPSTEVAEIRGRNLRVYDSSSSCGASNFQVVEYLTSRG